MSMQESMKEASETLRKVKAHKPKKWSHQRELEEAVGKQIKLALQNGADLQVELLAADQFTVRVQYNGITATMFKHNITAYMVL